MRPHDPHAWSDPYGYCAALAPIRRPPSGRGHRERLRARTRRMQRDLKRGTVDMGRPYPQIGSALYHVPHPDGVGR